MVAAIVATSVGNGSRDGVLVDAKPQEFTAQYTKTAYGGMSSWDREVLAASTDDYGNLTFSRAQATKYTPNPNNKNKSYGDFTVTHGAYEGRLLGVDLSKAKTVTGQTYSIKEQLKKAGFRWSQDTKGWTK